MKLPSRTRLLPLLAVAVAASLAYANAWDAPLVFDGIYLIRFNPAIRPNAAWHEFLQAAGTRPVGFATFALNYRLHYDSVLGYHLVNRAIHLINGCLLLLVMEHTFRRGTFSAVVRRYAIPIATLAALLWVVHPIHTQSVTNIAQRFESLCGMFVLLAVASAQQAIDAPSKMSSRIRWQWQGVAIVACQLAVLTKEVGAMTPLVIAAYDSLAGGRSWREIYKERRGFYLALCLTWIPLMGLMALQPARFEQAGVGRVAGLTPLAYLTSQPWSILQYLRVLVDPSQQCFDYGWPPVTTWDMIVVPTLGLLLLALVAMRFQGGPLAVVIAGLVLLPSSSLVPIRDVCVEHRMYLPSAVVIGLICGVVASFIANLKYRIPDRFWYALWGFQLVIVPLCLGVVTHQRNDVYRNPLRLWQDTAAKSPGNPRAHYEVAVAALQIDEPELAREALAQTLRFAPQLPQPASTTAGLCEADREFVSTLLPANLWNNAARRYASLTLDAGDAAGAIKWIDWVADREPLQPADQVVLGRALLVREQFEAAEQAFVAALKLAPNNAEAHKHLGELRQRQGYRQAAAYHRTAAQTP